MEGKNTFNLVKEHPSHKYMVMSEQKNIFIPCINSLNLLPNVEDLRIDNIITEMDTTRTREEYAKIILLLFYPYRVQDDLLLNESYWDRYNVALSEHKISPHGLQVIQNI